MDYPDDFKHDKSRTKEELTEIALNRSFSEEVTNDVVKLKQQQKRGDLHLLSEHEKDAVRVMNRAFDILDKGGLTIRSDDKVVSASENKLPLASYLSHGGRVLIEIPPHNNAENPDKLFNWLTSGNPEANNVADTFERTEAKQMKKGVYKRRAATHGVEIEGGDTIETRGFFVGAKSALKSFFSDTKHYGADLSLNVDSQGKDSEGKRIISADTEHGHMYIHYKPPKDNLPGSIMIGLESSGPTSSSHSKAGTPNVVTAAGGTKWKDFKKKDGKPDGVIMPDEINGMRVNLTTDIVDKLIQTSNPVPNLGEIPSVAATEEQLKKSQKIASKLSHKKDDLAKEGQKDKVNDKVENLILEEKDLKDLKGLEQIKFDNGQDSLSRLGSLSPSNGLVAQGNSKNEKSL